MHEHVLDSTLECDRRRRAALAAAGQAYSNHARALVERDVKDVATVLRCGTDTSTQKSEIRAQKIISPFKRLGRVAERTGSLKGKTGHTINDEILHLLNRRSDSCLEKFLYHGHDFVVVIKNSSVTDDLVPAFPNDFETLFAESIHEQRKDLRFQRHPSFLGLFSHCHKIAAQKNAFDSVKSE